MGGTLVSLYPTKLAASRIDQQPFGLAPRAVIQVPRLLGTGQKWLCINLLSSGLNARLRLAEAVSGCREEQAPLSDRFDLVF